MEVVMAVQSGYRFVARPRFLGLEFGCAESRTRRTREPIMIVEWKEVKNTATCVLLLSKLPNQWRE